MRLIVLAILTALSMSACDSAHQRLLKTMEKQVSQTIQMDWDDGIPLPDLLDAHKMCQQERTLAGCDAVISQLTDISLALTSCKEDQRSKLCKAIIHAISSKSVIGMTPNHHALTLPDNPLYWSLPTRTLKSQSAKFGYRTEVTGWWWRKWRTHILSSTTLFFIGIVAWKWFGYRGKISQQHADILAEQRAERIKQQHIQKVNKEHAQKEKERLEWLEIEKALAIEQRIAEENLAKQQEAETAARLAAEQDEAAKLLQSIFATTKPSLNRTSTASSSSADSVHSTSITQQEI